jgi:hypothetical protein
LWTKAAWSAFRNKLIIAQNRLAANIGTLGREIAVTGPSNRFVCVVMGQTGRPLLFVYKKKRLLAV